MRALVIADDMATAEGIEMMLAKERFIYDTAGLGEDCVAIGKRYDYDIIILDLSPSKIEGYRLVQQLRTAGVRTPVLVLAAPVTVDLKIKCLGFGADDFLTKPVDFRELIARIRAIIRRCKGHPESKIRIGRLVINLDTRVVAVADQPVPLTPKEYGMLELLSLRKGAVVTKEIILNHLYGGMDEPDLKIVDVYVCKLRKKLAQATGGNHYIETVWGRGYAIRDAISASATGNSGAGLADPLRLLTL